LIGTVLKRDVFGTVTLVESEIDGHVQHRVVRDVRDARWWARAFAVRLADREARALERLQDVAGVPRLLGWDGRRLERTFIVGRPMHLAAPRNAAYFRAALKLVRRMHAAGVLHNDLAKEPNWLVDANDQPALVDFQLAGCRARHDRWCQMLGRDDLRHLLKHKRTYCPEQLTMRQRRMLAQPSPLSRGWRRTGKPVYRFVTRRLLGWADREGAGDR